MISHYFSHDYNSASDLKIACLLSDHGAVGYGLFWNVVERLHQEKEHRLPLKKYVYSVISKQLLITIEQIETILKDCFETYELFQTDGEYFWSDRVLRNTDELDEKYQKLHEARSRAGKIGNEIRWNKNSENTNESIAKSQINRKISQTSLKEIKGNEIKGKEIKEKKDIYICENSDQLLKKILGRYKTKISRKVTSEEIIITPNIRKTLEEKLKVFQPLDLLLGIEGFSNNTWQMKENGHRGADWFFQDTNRLEQYIGFYNKDRNLEFIKTMKEYLIIK